MKTTALATLLVLSACVRHGSSAEEEDRPAVRAACPPSLAGAPGHCRGDERCSYPEGFCRCGGYGGGIPPEPGVDYSHFECGRTKSRTDGCPDDVTPGGPCAGARLECFEAQGLPCGPLYACRGGAWETTRNTCVEIN